MLGGRIEPSEVNQPTRFTNFCCYFCSLVYQRLQLAIDHAVRLCIMHLWDGNTATSNVLDTKALDKLGLEEHERLRARKVSHLFLRWHRQPFDVGRQCLFFCCCVFGKRGMPFSSFWANRLAYHQPPIGSEEVLRQN